MLSDEERKSAREVYFSSAWLLDEVLHVPCGLHKPEVRFDLKSRTAVGPDPNGEIVTVQLDRLQRFVIDHRSWQGDLKVHHFYTVYLHDGENCLCLYERAKEYFEYHPDIQEDYYQVIRAVHALPGLLGLRAEMEHSERGPADPRATFARRPEPEEQKPSSTSETLTGLLIGGAVALAWILLRRR